MLSLNWRRLTLIYIYFVCDKRKHSTFWWVHFCYATTLVLALHFFGLPVLTYVLNILLNVIFQKRFGGISSNLEHTTTWTTLSWTNKLYFGGQRSSSVWIDGVPFFWAQFLKNALREFLHIWNNIHLESKTSCLDFVGHRSKFVVSVTRWLSIFNNISETAEGNFYRFATNIHLGSNWINWFELGVGSWPKSQGQTLRSAWLDGTLCTISHNICNEPSQIFMSAETILLSTDIQPDGCNSSFLVVWYNFMYF